MTRKFDELSSEQKEWLLYACEWLSWRDVASGIITGSGQLQSAIAYGSKYQINSEDYAAVETVFPSQGEPQPPKK